MTATPTVVPQVLPMLVDLKIGVPAFLTRSGWYRRLGFFDKTACAACFWDDYLSHVVDDIASIIAGRSDKGDITTEELDSPGSRVYPYDWELYETAALLYCEEKQLVHAGKKPINIICCQYIGTALKYFRVFH
ncbi:hypothetical protein MPER_12231 [Moniliophthora perniciosa FA553]|nr:hypothetical protein MPER_12231 [Moniliophthora perniciosa FA553]